MSTQQLQLVCDSSSLANYKAWAKPISDWYRTLGYTNTTDSGQLNGSGAGHGGTDGWTNLAGAPGSGAFFYEIFQSPDTPTFYVRIEYGNVSGTNCPSVKIGIGTAVNGAGNLNGFFTAQTKVNPSSYTVPSAVTAYECNFSGASSKIAAMMWRNAPANQGQLFFAIQRSLDAEGDETSDYVTLWTAGVSSGGGTVPWVQQSLHFTYGLSTVVAGATATGNGAATIGAHPCRGSLSSSGGLQFRGKIPVDLCSPLVGEWDNVCTICGLSDPGSIAEGVPFNVTLKGNVVKTYMPSKIGPFANWAGIYNGSGGILCMEYD